MTASSSSCPFPSSSPTPVLGRESGIVKKARPAVLVVDPDPGARGDLASALAPRFEVYEADEGLTAMRLAQTILPALVIVEVELPVLDGFVLARSIKSQRGALRHTPIVFLSARSAPRDIAQAIAAGARRYLIKPCVPESLTAIATRIVHG